MAAGMEVAKLFATFGADVSDFSKAMQSVDKDLNTFQKGMSGMQTAVSTGLKAAVGVGIAAVGGLSAAIVGATKSAIDMEQGIADTGAAMNLSAEETAKLKELIMDLGLDPNLKVSATEASQAIDSLGRNGLTMTQIMDGAAKSTVLLANATGADFGTAADIATDVMQQFNISAADMDKAVSAISGVTIASKFTIDDYRLAIAQAGGVAGSVGVEFDDFNAVIAAISPNFASGSDAGTSFKTLLQRLVPSTEAAKEVMVDLGFTTTETANAFFDASGNMKSMDEIAGVLKKGFSGLSEEQKNQAASTLFGTDAMRAAFGLIDAGQETILEYKKNIGNTSAEDLAARRMDTLRGAFEIFGGIIETVSIGVGDRFLPVVRKIVEWASEMASNYGPKVIDWFGKLADWLGRATEGVIALFSGGEKFSEWLVTLPEPMQDVVNGIMAFYEGAKALFKGIADVIGQFVKWQDVLAAVALVVASIVLPAIWALITAVAPIIAAFATVVAAVAALRNAWEADFLGIKTATLAAFDYLKETFGGLFTAIQTFGKGALLEIKNWLMGNETSFENVNRIWEVAKATFSKVFTDMGSALRAFGDFLWTEFKDRFPAAANILEGAMTSLKWVWDNAWNSIKGVVRTGLESIAGWLKQYTGIWQGDWDSTMDYLTSGMGIQALRLLLTVNIPGYIMSMVRTGILMFTNWKAHIYDTWLNIKDEAIRKWDEIVYQVTWHWKYWMLELEREFITPIKNKFIVTWQSISFATQLAWKEIVEWTTKKWDEWFGWFKPTEWFTKGAAIIQGLWDGMKSIWNGFWSWTTEKWQGMVDWFRRLIDAHSPSRVFMAFGQAIGDGLRLGIGSSTTGVLSAMDTLGAGVIARANALELSLEGSIAQIASRITSLQNHQAALTNIQQLGQNQLDTYKPTTPAPNPSPYANMTAQQMWFSQTFGTHNADHIANIIRTFDTLAGFGSQLAGNVQDFIMDVGLNVAGNLADSQTQNQLYDIGQENVSMELLTQALHALIAELRQTGGPASQEFNLSLAPTQTGNLLQDAGALINYLRTLYAS